MHRQTRHARSEKRPARPAVIFSRCPDSGRRVARRTAGLQVRLRDGTVVPTHGTDVALADDRVPAPERQDTTEPSREDVGDSPVARAASNTNTSYPSFSSLVDPSCYAEEGRVQLVYTHASDVSDAYNSTTTSEMRTTLRRMNTWLREEALNDSNSSTAARLRAVCHSTGTLLVSDAGQSAYTASNANYSDVVSELRSKGYSDPDKKYLILFDTGDCKPSGGGRCATGVGTWWNDASRTTTNPANQPYSNSFAAMALVWGPRYFSETGTTALHELLHGMGAVNTAAPYATGSSHCWDDLDTMCRNDGGTNPPGAIQSRCSLSSIDCFSDSYYRVGASSGWLAENWQVGYTGNRFISFG